MGLQGALDRARELFERQSWGAAYNALHEAELASPLDPADLERLAIASYLTGQDTEAGAAWSRAHREYAAARDVLAALRCVVWLGIVHLLRGQQAQAQGWFARARHLAAGAADESLETAYLDQAAGLEALFGGDPAVAAVRLEAAAGTARRCGDADLAGISRLGCGQALIMVGRVAEGVPMLDEAMVAVAAGEVSAIATGLIYCAVVETCQELFDLRRAQEWTTALGHWCDAQPDLVPYRGQCLVHRAELLRIHGSWSDAVDQAEHASRRLSEPAHPALGAAYYEQAELHRLRGDGPAAEQAYRSAAAAGHGAQPGLALLRLGQRQTRSAAAAVDRALTEPQSPAARARLLAARVDIALAASDLGDARAAAEELGSLADELDGPPMLAAMVDDAVGAVRLADGDPRAALQATRRAWTIWRQLDVPYEAARCRVRLGLACRELGDEDAAGMELAAARQVFLELGAAPDVARVDGLQRQRPAPGGLTAREVQILTLVATGSTNRAIAAALTISEKTVARHVSNIFGKLGVSSRSAATAYAYREHLV